MYKPSAMKAFNLLFMYLKRINLKKWPFATCVLMVLFQCMLVINATAQKALPKPNPPRLFVDDANLVIPSDAASIEQKLVAIDDSTSNQIAVVTVNSLNGQAIEEVALNTFREWGIGNAKTNNGILLLISKEDRAIRIEVGYGLEGAIPDVVAKAIIENDIKPFFKKGDFYNGIDAGINSLYKAAVGEYKIAKKKKANWFNDTTIFFIIFFAVIILSIIINSGGGRGGGGRSSMVDFFTPFIVSSALGGGGRSSGWGGDSGGGFGGFGGGSSGGGGASGSW